MTPTELVAAVQAAGGDVQRFSDGRTNLKGQIPAELVALIKADREAFLDAWDAEIKGRYERVPPENLRMRSEPPRWRKDVYRRVEGYVRRQGSAVCLWVTMRATAYWEAGMASEAATASALDDVLHWQMSHRPNPEWQLETFDEVAEFFRGKDVNP